MQLVNFPNTSMGKVEVCCTHVLLPTLLAGLLAGLAGKLAMLQGYCLTCLLDRATQMTLKAGHVHQNDIQRTVRLHGMMGHQVNLHSRDPKPLC